MVTWHLETRLANMPPRLIGMEGCIDAYYPSRRLNALGNDTRLMPITCAPIRCEDEVHEDGMQTGRRTVYAGSRLSAVDNFGRRRLERSYLSFRAAVPDGTIYFCRRYAP